MDIIGVRHAYICSTRLAPFAVLGIMGNCLNIFVARSLTINLFHGFPLFFFVKKKYSLKSIILLF